MQLLPRHWMDEAELCRVKRLSSERSSKVEQGRTRPFASPFMAVKRIADNIMTNMGHMNANLMGPAGFEPAIDMRGDLVKVL